MDDTITKTVADLVSAIGEGDPNAVGIYSSKISGEEIDAEKKESINAPEEAFFFSGKAADYGVMDVDGDVFAEGAFTESINYINAERGGRIGVYYNHKIYDTPIGVIYEFTEKSDGLYVKGFIDAYAPHANGVVRGIRTGALTDMSVTARIASSSVREESAPDGRRIRDIKSAGLREISVVWYGAQFGARLNAVRKASQPAAVDYFKIFNNAIFGNKQEEGK